MEDSGRVNDEGRPILERVDLMEAFFAGPLSDLEMIMYVFRASGGLCVSVRPRTRPYASIELKTLPTNLPYVIPHIVFTNFNTTQIHRAHA